MSEIFLTVGSKISFTVKNAYYWGINKKEFRYYTEYTVNKILIPSKDYKLYPEFSSSNATVTQQATQLDGTISDKAIYGINGKGSSWARGMIFV